jgi:tetratricopeptide (TPR) repeat protein
MTDGGAIDYNRIMSDSQEGRRLHALSEEARERGDFLAALEHSDQATLAYQKDGDLLGLAEVQSSRQSIFKHLYRQTKDGVWLILEKHAALAAVEIAQKSGRAEALALPYHNLGKYYFEAQEYQLAAEAFKKAVDNLTVYPDNRHSRPSVIADIKGHQFAAQYRAGDKTALSRALQALEALRAAREDNSYNRNAWISGAHLRIAAMLAENDPEAARRHLAQAKEIIDSDPSQVLRKNQLRPLEAELA